MSVNNFGKNLLVENCHKIAISDILYQYRINLKETILYSKFEMMNINVGLAVSKTGGGGMRFWFLCPNCERRVGILFIHPNQISIGCQKCLKLDYRKRND